MMTIMKSLYFTTILFLQNVLVLSLENGQQMDKRVERLEKIILHQNRVNAEQQIQLDKQQSVIKELQADISRMKVEISHCTSTKEHVSPQKRQYSPTEVAFSTQLTKHLTGLGHHAAVIFDKVILDTTSSYNVGDGVFTVPMTGIYVFTWTASVGNGNWETTELIVNGTPYAYTLVDAGASGDYGSGTQTVVLKVNQSDHVLVRTGNTGDGKLDGNKYDTFSGWILFPLE
ncbi:complement C1q tumor necrosis factor-related protein 3-like [Mytilus galloprovincialis]|uniref:complement C1q tumor necrosis factor-related protein 3-like n=1 Tax=Mytilus galloprovincialis TaxID=29158 RepID=UPI003F7C350B